MKHAAQFAGGLGIGISVMYLLDPKLGRRRRAVLSSKKKHWSRWAFSLLEKGIRDFRNRGRGWTASAKRVIPTSKLGAAEASDAVITSRVRSKAGRMVTHFGNLRIEAREGVVYLDGEILRSEMQSLLSTVTRIPGVSGVVSRLEPRAILRKSTPPKRPDATLGERYDVFQKSWAPATRILAVLSGACGIVYGVLQRGVAGWTVSGLSAFLALRGASNLESKRLLGLSNRGTIHIHKTFQVRSSLEQAFDFWASFENFPRWLHIVREVRSKGGNLSRWIIQGPAGKSFHFDTEVTHFEPNRSLAWRTLPGSVVRHTGRVRFVAEANDVTRIELDLSCSPPAGALGLLFAKLLGSDPKKLLEDSIVALRSSIEKGTVAA